jgi:hypothetical protein
LKTGGSFAISTFTAVKTTEAAIDKALSSRQIASESLDEKSLTSANYVKDSFLHVMKQLDSYPVYCHKCFGIILTNHL